MHRPLEDLSSEYLQAHSWLDADVTVTNLNSDLFIVRAHEDESFISRLVYHFAIFPKLDLGEYCKYCSISMLWDGVLLTNLGLRLVK